MKNNDKNTLKNSCCALCKNSNNCNRNKVDKKSSLNDKLEEENHVLAFKEHDIKIITA